MFLRPSHHPWPNYLLHSLSLWSSSSLPFLIRVLWPLGQSKDACLHGQIPPSFLGKKGNLLSLSWKPSHYQERGVCFNTMAPFFPSFPTLNSIFFSFLFFFFPLIRWHLLKINSIWSSYGDRTAVNIPTHLWWDTIFTSPHYSSFLFIASALCFFFALIHIETTLHLHLLYWVFCCLHLEIFQVATTRHVAYICR